MPYFTRRPYAERDLPAPAPAPAPPAREDFLAMAQAVLSPRGGDGEAPFTFRNPIRAGGRGAMTLELLLEGAGAPAAVSLSAGDLRGPSRSVIPAASLRVTPAAVTLSPGAAIPVEVAIEVPREATPGRYVGTVTLAGAENRILPIEAEIR